MELFCPADTSISIPFHIGSGESRKGPRIGGRAPLDVFPKRENGEYFATIPLTANYDTEISIFWSFDINEMLKRRSKLLQGSEFVEIVVHGTSQRGGTNVFSSHLSEHPIIFEKPVQDWSIDETGEEKILGGHKIGGRPYIDQWRPKFSEILERMKTDRLSQVLQIDFPGGGSDAVVSGDWPFGATPGMFHLFGKPPFSQADFFYFWEC